MNIQQLRQSLKMKWLNYYQQNRHWLVKMRVWGSYDGLRRPSSGFILATLSVLEPELEEMLAFAMDLNNNPDAIVTALGLNFNPDEELGMKNLDDALVINQSENELIEEKPVRSLTTTHKIISQPSSQTKHTEKPAADLPQAHQPLPAFAVATQVTLQSPSKIPTAAASHPSKPLSSLTLTAKVPSNGKTIALAVELPKHITPFPSNDYRLGSRGAEEQGSRGAEIKSVIFHREGSKLIPRSSVASPVKNLPSSAVTPEISRNGKPPEKLQSQKPANKTQPFPSTNASSLAAWVDEFCQGKV